MIIEKNKKLIYGVFAGEAEAMDPTSPHYMGTPVAQPIINECGDTLGYQVTWNGNLY